MATVYLARDHKHDRPVALKVLHPHLAATLGPERFEREIKLAARLQHPHIVAVHDSGEAAGQLWFSMPYVEGESLRDRLEREKQLTVEDALHIVREVALALDYAHRHDVLHRDIKPENILLTPDGSTLVADFGIARAITKDAERLTDGGMAVGTPAYMSPEQASGERGLDASTDVYALGCVLYEMLAGEAPYNGPTPMAILAKQLSLPIPSVRLLRPQAPEAVARALVRALGRAPADRFASAKQFAEALLSPADDDLPEQSIAVLPFSNLSADPANDYFSDGITEEIINTLSRVSSLRVAARTSSFAYKGKHVPIRQIGGALQVRTVLEGSVRWGDRKLRIAVQLINASDGYQLWSERYDREMADVFAIQDEIAHAIVDTLQVRLRGGPDEPLASRGTDDLEAYHLYLRGRHYWHAVVLTKAITCFEAAIARDPGYAQAHAALAQVYCSLGFYGYLPTSIALPKARAAAERAVALDDSLAEAHESLGRLELYFGWNFPVMERELRRAIALNSQLTSAYGWLGSCMALQGRLSEVKAQVVRAYELEPLMNTAVMAMLHICAHEFQLSITTCQRTLEINPDSVPALWVIGMAYAAEEAYEQAIASFEKGVSLTGRSSLLLAELGAALALAGRREEAIAILEELREMSGRAHVIPMAFAKLHMCLGNTNEMFTWLDRALEDHDPGAVWTPVLPCFEPMRRDPRYGTLLQKRGLEALFRASPAV